MKMPGRLLAAGAAALLVAASVMVATLLTAPLPFLPSLMPCLPAVTAPSGSGYSPPGLAALADAAVRMAAVWTAAAMARGRRGEGDTDVFLHDVDRRVEKAYAEEFLCERFRVGATGRLWHFRIPPASRRGNGTAAAGGAGAGDGRRPFC
uniref:Uncharacterized protein n=1 Tax=Oryza barthii TaxID=65489 RepID=A0A0D3HLW7_9ORYZ